MLTEGGSTDAARLRYLYSLITGRAPRPAELAAMERMWKEDMQMYRVQADKRKALLLVGSRQSCDVDEVMLAAGTHLALSLLNTDEFLTRK